MRGRKTDNRKDIIVGRARMKGLSVADLAKKSGLNWSSSFFAHILQFLK